MEAALMNKINNLTEEQQQILATIINMVEQTNANTSAEAKQPEYKFNFPPETKFNPKIQTITLRQHDFGNKRNKFCNVTIQFNKNKFPEAVRIFNDFVAATEHSKHGSQFAVRVKEESGEWSDYVIHHSLESCFRLIRVTTPYTVDMPKPKPKQPKQQPKTSVKKQVPKPVKEFIPKPVEEPVIETESPGQAELEEKVAAELLEGSA